MEVLRFPEIGFSLCAAPTFNCIQGILNGGYESSFWNVPEWRKHTRMILSTSTKVREMEVQSRRVGVVFESPVQPGFFTLKAGNRGQVDCLAPAFHQKPGSDRYGSTPSNLVAVWPWFQLAFWRHLDLACRIHVLPNYSILFKYLCK